MTDQQPHTPLDDLVSRMHTHFSAANTVGDDYSADDFADVIRILESLPADIAAAEQRGAIKALREAAESLDIIDHMYKHFDKRPSQAPVAVRATATYLHDRASQEEA